jgi:hypothetical protein
MNDYSNAFDIDIFDLPRSKNILHFFDTTYPSISRNLKFNCCYYEILFPYILNYFERKKELHFSEKKQNLIASSISFMEVKNSIETDFSFFPFDSQ